MWFMVFVSAWYREVWACMVATAPIGKAGWETIVSSMSNDNLPKPINRAKRNKQAKKEATTIKANQEAGGKPLVKPVKVEVKQEKDDEKEDEKGGEEGGGTEQKKTMKMDKKNVHSRAYHKTLAKLRKQGIDDDEAKQQARLEAKLAVVELAKAEAGFDV